MILNVPGLTDAQLAVYEPAMPERAHNLPWDLRAETEDLATELGNDLDALVAFWEDLGQRGQMPTDPRQAQGNRYNRPGARKRHQRDAQLHTAEQCARQ